ncbi:preprotein translocase subunit SecG [Plasticicumulans lactativorans]|uniref:preprotein translocase subunit SecG n=1 Tax=Plasticicumulans lactativorans TaxID=1133106 RepID=UPI003C7476C8
MYTVLLFVHVLVALLLIALVLMQQGKGADAGAAFGSGASATVFGARGAASFLSRTTSVLATAFFAVSLLLAYAMTMTSSPQSVVKTEVSVSDKPDKLVSPKVSDIPQPDQATTNKK